MTQDIGTYDGTTAYSESLARWRARLLVQRVTTALFAGFLLWAVYLLVRLLLPFTSCLEATR